jgi:ABC-2 type transport system ATP-binding protein
MDADVYTTLMEKVLLQADELSRSYGDFQAIHPVNFKVYAGEIVILTGPNGAGKTTLLHCLSGLLRPTMGSVLVEGLDLYREEVAAKQRLAFVPDVPRFYQELTSWEHLKFISLAYGIEIGWETRAEVILRELNLWDSCDLYPHNLSRGMRLKLGISFALIRPFKVLLMDEPTSALDPDSANLLYQRILTLQKEGCATLMTTHDLSTVEVLHATRWTMNRGKLETE